MTRVAVIGGTGLRTLKGLEITGEKTAGSPYGEPSAPLTRGTFAGREVIFLARHGINHTLPPHRVNYRANIWALHEAGVERIIAVAAVGGITRHMHPGRIALPEQIVDYTWSRAHTFFEDELEQVTHVDFTEPYCAESRAALSEAAVEAGLDVFTGGTYGATQGPRLESAAEINRMERDGCDMVGMTGMPEAGLARELGMRYAHCAVVANWAAGRGEGPISMEAIESNLARGMLGVRTLLETVLPRF